MFVAPLKNNFQISFLILLITSIGLWLLCFAFATTSSTPIIQDEQLWFSLAFQNRLPHWTLQLGLILIISVGAFFLNFLTISQEITSKTNYLPAFLYILLAFVSNTKPFIEPILLANLFVLSALYFLISSYKQEATASGFFNAGLFLCLATFFYMPYVFILPIAVISLLILRSFNWREWLLLLIGFIAPIYIYMCFGYLNNHSTFEIVSFFISNTNHFQKPVFSEYYFLLLIIMAFITCLAIFFYMTKGFGNKIKTTKTKYIMLWFLCLSLGLVFRGQTTDMILLPSVLPLSIIMGDYLAEIKQLKIANTLLFLFLLGCVVVYLHAFNLF